VTQFRAFLIAMSIIGIVQAEDAVAPISASSSDASAYAAKSLLPEPARDFKMTGPVLHPSERRSMDLTPGDFNGDGLLDFATIANDKSIIEIFLNDKKAETLFTKETVTLDNVVRSMTALDINGDGRTDLLLTQQGAQVGVMYQSKEGRLQPAEETPLQADYAFQGDLNGDKAEDVVLFRKGVFQVLHGKTRGLDLEPALTFYTSYEPASDPMILDLDSDGKNDIIFQDSTARDKLIVRLQAGDGTFPAEFVMTPGLMRSVAPMPIEGSRGTIIAVQDKTRHLVQLRLSEPRTDTTTEGALELSQLNLVPFDPETTSDKLDTAVADVDGDGRMDLLVSSPKVPALRVLHQKRSGSLEVSMVPSLEGIEQVLSLPGKSGEPTPLLLYSKKEKAAGLVFGKKGSSDLPFPKLLPELGAPKATAIINIGGKSHILALVDSKENKEALRALELQDQGVGSATEVLADGADLGDLKLGEGNGLSVMDLNQDGKDDIAVFAEFRPAALFTQNANGRFAPVSVKGGVLEGLLSEMTRGKLVGAKIDTAEKPVVLAVKAGFVRAIYLDAKNNLEVAEQFNGRNSRARLAAATTGNFRSKKNRDIAILDSGNRTVAFWGVKEAGGRYEELFNAELDSGDYRALEVLDLDGDERDDLLLVAADRVAVLYTRRLNSGLETVASTQTKVEEGGYSAVYTTQLFPGGAREIVALEARQNVLEFFTAGKDEAGKPALLRFYQFRAYETDSSMAQRINMEAPPEPREVTAVDFDESGKPALLALTHDFVLRYNQEEAAAGKK
jgi:hypothetical protein